MLLATISVPSAAAGPAATGNRLLAALSRTSWRRPSDFRWAAFARAPVGSPSYSLHTCELRAHPYFKYLLCFVVLVNGVKRAIPHRMKLAWLGCLVVGLLHAGNQDSDLNVNKRYTVDTVTVAGKGW